MSRIFDLARHEAAYVTVQELAQYLCVHERTLYHHIEKGALVCVRLGGPGSSVLRIPISEARRYAQVAAGD